MSSYVSEDLNESGFQAIKLKGDRKDKIIQIIKDSESEKSENFDISQKQPSEKEEGYDSEVMGAISQNAYKKPGENVVRLGQK